MRSLIKKTRLLFSKKLQTRPVKAATEQHARLLDTVNTAAAILLKNIDVEGFEASLIKCFDLIGYCLDVDRVQIWRNEIFENEPHFVLSYEWLSDYGKGCKAVPIGLHFPYRMKKEWGNLFLRGENINSPLCELSKEDQAFWGFYEIKSIVIIPMFLDEDFWGFFSIDDCRRERTFSEEEISILTSAGLMMSSAANRNIQTIKMRESKEAILAEMRKAEIAEESSKAKSDFLARMSHEIRTPLNAILGITEIQLQDDKHSQGTKEALERIYSSGSLLLGIINDILDLSKIEAGKLILIPDQYDIASLIHDTVQLVIMRYESKPIEFKLNVDENLPLILVGDELRIKQILNNLLSNAYKYTREGTVTLTVFTELTANSETGNTTTLVFIVSDTGQGMTAEQVNKLGTEYARFNMEANRNTEGTGLGMSITHNLIRLMNGSISIESTYGKGSMFEVRLPQKYVSSSVIGKELADNLMQLNIGNAVKIRNMQMKMDFMPYGSVLIVDDVETNLYVARGLMAPYELSIDTVMSGFEAVEKIRNGFSYDIIFMDHMMPNMDGIEAAKIIRGLGYSKPIVALTANALAGQDQIFMDNGFDDFISKPIDTRHLNLMLNKFIRDKYPADVVEAAQKQIKKQFLEKKRNKSVDPQLAEFFVRDAKKAVKILEAIYLKKCRRSDDIAALIINVHAMKSALFSIGETDLSEDASKLEQAAREENVEFILTKIPSFFEQLYSVINRFEADEEVQKETGDDSDYVFLKEKLTVVKLACESFNKITAKNALAEIRKKTWHKSVNEQLGNFAEFLLHSDFDEAAKAIDEYLKQL